MHIKEKQILKTTNFTKSCKICSRHIAITYLYFIYSSFLTTSFLHIVYRNNFEYDTYVFKFNLISKW